MSRKKHIETAWRDKTKDLFINRPAWLTIEVMSNDLNISPQWLRAFGRGAIENPGVNTVEKLNLYLTKKVKHVSKHSA